MLCNFGEQYSACNIVFDNDYVIESQSTKLNFVNSQSYVGNIVFPENMNFHYKNGQTPNANKSQSVLLSFSQCKRFSAPVVIPNGITGLERAFSNTAFNHPITIPETVRTCGSMFYGQSAIQYFNSDVTFSTPVTGFLSCYYMFMLCSNFNGRIINFSNVRSNTQGMFQGCEKFNQIVGDINSSDCEKMFLNCFEYNQPTHFLEIGTKANSLFANCRSLNKPVTIDHFGINNSTYSGFTSCNFYGMFMDCYNFNQDFDFPSPFYPENIDYQVSLWALFGACHNFNANVNLMNIDNLNTVILNSLFTNCTNYNQPISFPNNINKLYLDGVFHKCRNFNHPIVIPNGTVSCSEMFYLCNNFNSTVEIISNNISSFYAMFDGCILFDKPVNIPDQLQSNVNCANMFLGCKMLNSPINIGNNVNSCTNMFRGCDNFNQPLIIPETVNNCYQMLYLCKNFNQQITFPSSGAFCHHMLNGCSNFNHALTLPDTPNFACAYLLSKCYNYGKDLYVPDTVGNFYYVIGGAIGGVMTVSVPTLSKYGMNNDPRTVGIGHSQNTVGSQVVVRDIGRTYTLVYKQVGASWSYVWE